MKRLLIVLGVVVALAAGAMLALPALVPAERIKSEVVAQVKAATGRDLSIDGKVAVSVLPSLSVQVANVALSNPPGFSAKDMVRLGALDVKLKLLPLLSGRVEVDSFVLVDPVVTLETDRKGRGNWVFGDAGPAPSSAAGPAGKGAGMDTAGPAEVMLGDVAIRNGRLIYVDGVGGTREEVTGIDLAVSLPGLDASLAVQGGLTWRGQGVDLAVDVATPRAVLDGGASAAAVRLSAKLVSLSFKGQAGTTGATGDLDLSVPSVRDLVKWTTGKPLEMAGTGLGPLSLTGSLSAEASKVALSQAKIALDAIKATGDVAVDAGGARPAIKGRLAVERLDVTPYLPPEQAKPAAAGGVTAPGGTGAARADWSNAPIDASGLKAADMDVTLTAEAIKIRAVEIGKSALRLILANGRMTADLAELHLYKGGGTGRLVVDGSQPGLGIDAGFTLAGVQAGPFLAAAAGFDRLEGTGAADIQVSGRGRTERQLIGSLSGKGGITFLDGAIQGINLAAMVRNVTTAFTDTSGSQKTDFAELSGTYAMSGGIVSNRDLSLKSPLLRVEGAGNVDLPRRSLNYRVEPKAVASLEGQGGRADLAGLAVPVIVEGPWDGLTYRPDLEAMVKGQATKALEGLITGGDGSKPTIPLPLPGGLFGR